MLLRMYQVFNSLQGHLHFFVHFFFTFMGQFFLGHPIPPQYLFYSFFSTASSAPYCVRVYYRVSLPQDELVTGCLVFPALVTQDYNYRRIGPSCAASRSAGLCKYTFPLVGRCVRASL